MRTRFPGARLPLWAGILTTLAIGGLAVAPMALAAGPATIGLNTAAPFAVLAGTPAVTNTGPTTITGDVGIAPAAAVTGFPPGIVNGGIIHPADAVALQAKADLVTAYDQAAGLAVTATHATLGGLTLVGGVYTAGGATLDLTGTLILDGQDDPTSVWVFQATSDLITAASSRVELINQASACNVFWQVTSSATLGTGSIMVGTIMALTSITMADSVTLTGRALARNGTVTLINDTINASTCVAGASSPAAPSGAASSAPAAPGVPNTAFSSAEGVAPWPLFMAMVVMVIVSLLVIVRVTMVAERSE